MAKVYKFDEDNEGRPWEFDDLANSGLDRILSVEDDERPCLPDEESESLTDSESNMEHSSTWPVPRAAKQDSSKKSFLDLPPEIRITIYQHYCQAVLKDLSFDHMPASMHNICNGTPAQSLEPRLICHQIGSEFSPVWARCQTFLLSSDFAFRTPQDLDKTWFHVRDFLEWTGPATRQHVRKIRVSHIWTVDFPRLDPYDRRPYTPALDDNTADLVVSFERLTDVHKDLKIEVEIRYVGFHDAPNFRAFRRIFTTSQRSFGRQPTPDWTVDVGNVQYTEYQRVTYRCRRPPHSPYFKDEHWKLEADARRRG